MDRHLIKGLILIILLPAILIPANSMWVTWQDLQNFKVYYGKISEAMDKGIQTNTFALDADYRQKMEDWNNHFSGKLERIYTVHHNDGRETTDEAIPITRDLFEGLLQLRREFADLVVAFMSEKMQDPKTVSDKESYEWRLNVLNDIEQFHKNYDQRVDQLIETFRQSVVNSSLPIRHKEYMWQEWGSNVRGKLINLGPHIEHLGEKVNAYRQLFNL